MGRVSSGKHASDMETSAESVIHSSMVSSTLRKRDDAAVKLSVTASLRAEAQMDDHSEKKL